jgi:hypothetical protein
LWLKYRASWHDSVDSMGTKEAALTVGTTADSDSDWDDDVIYSRDPAERRLRAVAVAVLVVANHNVHARLRRQRTAALLDLPTLRWIARSPAPRSTWSCRRHRSGPVAAKAAT